MPRATRATNEKEKASQIISRDHTHLYHRSWVVGRQTAADYGFPETTNQPAVKKEEKKGKEKNSAAVRPLTAYIRDSHSATYTYTIAIKGGKIHSVTPPAAKIVGNDRTTVSACTTLNKKNS